MGDNSLSNGDNDLHAPENGTSDFPASPRLKFDGCETLAHIPSTRSSKSVRIDAAFAGQETVDAEKAGEKNDNTSAQEEGAAKSPRGRDSQRLTDRRKLAMKRMLLFNDSSCSQVYHKEHGMGRVLKVHAQPPMVEVKFKEGAPEEEVFTYDADTLHKIQITAVSGTWGNFVEPELRDAYLESGRSARMAIAQRMVIPIASVSALMTMGLIFYAAIDRTTLVLYSVPNDPDLDARFARYNKGGCIVAWMLALASYTAIGFASRTKRNFQGLWGTFWVSLLIQTTGFICLTPDWISYSGRETTYCGTSPGTPSTLLQQNSGNTTNLCRDVAFYPDQNLWALLLLLLMTLMIMAPAVQLLTQVEAAANGIVLVGLYVIGLLAMGSIQSTVISWMSAIAVYMMGWVMGNVTAKAQCLIFLKTHLKDINASISGTAQLLSELQEGNPDVDKDALIFEGTEKHRWMVPARDIIRKAKLGEGGFGDVFIALYHQTPVALKTAKELDAAAFQDFVDEYTLHMDVNHPNIVQILGACLEPDPVEDVIRCSLLLELMPNGSLDALIYTDDGSQPEPISKQLQLQMSLDIAMAVEHLHACKPAIIHCDLKSDNVFVDQSMHCKIGDMGGSRFVNKKHTHATAPISILWASPQRCRQLLGIDQVITIDTSDDTYAFGVMLYEICMQEEPFSEYGDPQEVVKAIARDERVLPSIMPDEVAMDTGAKQMWDLIDQCTALDRPSRPSMTDVCEILHQLNDAK